MIVPNYNWERVRKWLAGQLGAYDRTEGLSSTHAPFRIGHMVVLSTY